MVIRSAFLDREIVGEEHTRTVVEEDCTFRPRACGTPQSSGNIERAVHHVGGASRMLDAGAGIGVGVDQREALAAVADDREALR